MKNPRAPQCMAALRARQNDNLFFWVYWNHLIHNLQLNLFHLIIFNKLKWQHFWNGKLLPHKWQYNDTFLDCWLYIISIECTSLTVCYLYVVKNHKLSVRGMQHTVCSIMSKIIFVENFCHGKFNCIIHIINTTRTKKITNYLVAWVTVQLSSYIFVSDCGPQIYIYK